MIQNKKFVKNFFLILFLAGLVSFLAYSIFEYKRSDIEQEGVVTCVDNECFWSAHIHLYIPIQICGKEYSLSKFKGPLSGRHTHGDENIIHWHDKVAFDADKNQFLGPNPFALELIFQTLGLSITDNSLLGKDNGDTCEGFSDSTNSSQAAIWKVFVNGVLYPNWRNYEWKDLDIVHFFFDERTAEEVTKEISQDKLKFPVFEPD